MVTLVLTADLTPQATQLKSAFIICQSCLNFKTMGQNQSPHPLGSPGAEAGSPPPSPGMPPRLPFRRHPCSEQDWGKLLSEYLKVEEIRRKGNQRRNRGSDGRSQHTRRQSKAPAWGCITTAKRGHSSGLCVPSRLQEQVTAPPRQASGVPRFWPQSSPGWDFTKPRGGHAGGNLADASFP